MGQAMSVVDRSRRPTEGREVQEIRRCLALETCRAQRDDPASLPTPSKPKEPYQQDSKFMGLPLDMILIIFDPLDAHDAVALSLTCKGLYQHLFADARIRFKNTSREGRQEVQTMLEKDLPWDQVYCGFCRTFHTLNDTYRRTYCLENQQPGLSSFATQVPGILTSKLKYLDARAILNIMLSEKPTSKKLLESLERKVSAGATESPWTQTWEFNKYRGALLAMITSTHSNHRPRRYHKNFTYSVCKHVHLHASFPNMWVNHAGFFLMFICPEGDYASGTCLNCHTDWEVTLKYNKDMISWTSHGWEIEVHSWHRLGRLRSPSDQVWARCAGEYVSPDEMLPGVRWKMITSEDAFWNMRWERYFLRYPYQRQGYRGQGIPIGPYHSRWIDAKKRAS